VDKPDFLAAFAVQKPVIAVPPADCVIFHKIVIDKPNALMYT